MSAYVEFEIAIDTMYSAIIVNDRICHYLKSAVRGQDLKQACDQLSVTLRNIPCVNYDNSSELSGNIVDYIMEISQYIKENADIAEAVTIGKQGVGSVTYKIIHKK